MEKLRIKITLLAAIIVGICSFILGTSLEKTALILIITIILFYILGMVSELSITKYIDKKQEEIDRLEQEEKEKLEREEEEKEKLELEQEEMENIQEDIEGKIIDKNSSIL